MISPSYSITSTERVLPSLALNFTTASLDSRVTLTRTGNTATATNSSGLLAIVNANLPRFDYDPTTLVCRGLLIEEARTNALVNSLLDGTSLTTQTVTVTAVARTLSFYGTGTIVLSGAASATVVGTGAYPSRQTYTFTPTTGALILTVTGTVQFAQLETGAFATSYIPTTTATTRNADVATMTGTNFTSWYNATAGSLVATFIPVVANFAANRYPVSISNGTTNEALAIRMSSGAFFGYCNTGGVSQYLNSAGTATNNTVATCCMSLSTAGGLFAANATLGAAGAAATMPTVTRLAFGDFSGTAQGAYTFQKIMYYPQRLISRETQAFTK